MALQPSFVLIPVVLLVPAVFSIYPRFFYYTRDNSRCTRTLNRMGTVFTGMGMGMRKYTRGLPLAILNAFIPQVHTRQEWPAVGSAPAAYLED